MARWVCGKWSCRECANWKKRQWGLHIGAKLLQANGAIFEMTTEAEGWGRDQKRLSRLRASWVRINTSLAGGSFIIGVAPSPVGKMICDRDRAIGLLGAALRSLVVPAALDDDERNRPINRSTDWALPPKEPRYAFLGWVRANDPNQVLARLGAVGITGRPRRGDGERLWHVTYDVPTSWGPRELAALDEALAGAA